MNPFQLAKEQGYSDEEVFSYLEKHPEYSKKISTARQQGYSDKDISKYLSGNKEEIKENPQLQNENSFGEKLGRLAGQFGIGAAENALLPYEIATAPLAIPGGQEAMGDLFTREVLSDVYPNEQEGKNLEPRELKEPINIGIRGLIEKATGLNTHPEGLLEKAASWKGFLTNIKKSKDLAKTGLTSKDILNFVGGKDTARSLGAATALELAEDGNYGPIGTIGSAVVGDILGAGLRGAIKGTGKLVTSPKKTLANTAAKFTPKEKLDLQKDVIKSLRENDLPANLGTLTENKFIQGMEAKLAQSSLSGSAPDKLKKAMTDQIKSEYKIVADSLGESRFQTLHEAGEVSKEALTKARDLDKKIHSELYEKARSRLSSQSIVSASNVARAIQKIENNLSLGALKSPEQKKVLDVLETLKQDIYGIDGKLKNVGVQKLMNNKTALNDIIDYEIQGGQKQLLKNVVAEIDKSILSYGVKDKQFLKEITGANKKFIDHVKTYRNDNIDKILRSQDPMTVMNKMNTVQGLKDIKKALEKYPEGKKLFDDLSRTKLDMMIGNKMADNVSTQVKAGTFANLLKNPKDEQLIKELLPKDSFSRLKSLMKNTGKLEETAQKFFNASKSGVTVIDAALIGNVLLKIAAIFSGNPWPFAKAAGVYIGAGSISKLIYDQNFLKLVEDAILVSEKNDMSTLMNIGKSLEEYLKQSIPAAGEQERSNQANL